MRTFFPSHGTHMTGSSREAERHAETQRRSAFWGLERVLCSGRREVGTLLTSVVLKVLVLSPAPNMTSTDASEQAILSDESAEVDSPYDAKELAALVKVCMFTVVYIRVLIVYSTETPD